MEMVGPPGLEPDDVGWGGLLGYLIRPAPSWTVPGKDSRRPLGCAQKCPVKVVKVAITDRCNAIHLNEVAPCSEVTPWPESRAPLYQK